MYGNRTANRNPFDNHPPSRNPAGMGSNTRKCALFWSWVMVVGTARWVCRVSIWLLLDLPKLSAHSFYLSCKALWPSPERRFLCPARWRNRKEYCYTPQVFLLETVNWHLLGGVLMELKTRWLCGLKVYEATHSVSNVGNSALLCLYKGHVRYWT